MTVPSSVGGQHLTLANQRTLLLARIQVAREETTVVLERLAYDARATEKTRLAILGGWKILKAATVAGGVIWSFNAASNSGRGRRFFTLAVSLLSAMRTLRKVSAFF